MRGIVVAFVTALLGACATSQDVSPREFLDEQTAATITIVANPVIFVGETQGPRGLDLERSLGQSSFGQGANRDYLELYGIDVNRMGSHRQYFVIQKWLTPKDSDPRAILELMVDGSMIELRATPEDPRKLGISAPPAPVFSRSSQWWYFPTDTATLRRIAGASSLDASLVIGEHRTAYEIFTDGRAQLGGLAAALP
ncbi:hypothetical protein [Povalibacter sp.]|uniref:hypothetical protein n=1 Tax=Povalibacter sp. TaxID=1962978 RepID=UPI002F420781